MSDLLLERVAELAAIDRAIRVARAGGGRQVVIAGPPGSGKTALLERAQARAAALGLTVLAAGGVESEREFPFAVVRRLLEPSADRYDALLEMQRRIAAVAPALIAVDDLHACDHGSLDWLGFVARRLRRAGLAVIVGVDSGERPLVGALEEAGACVLTLEPLGERAVSAIARTELGDAVDVGFAAACLRATGGNPLLVRELVGATRDSSVVSPGVARFLERRLGRLAPEVCTLARAIAVLGGGTLRDAAELAGLGRDDAAAAADALRDAGLLDGLTITPPVLSRALYDAIPPARRALLHARAARLAALAGAPVLRHLLAAEPSADPWVVVTLRRAAAGALERGEPAEAVILLRRAGQEAVSDGRADLLAALASAEHRLGDPAEIEHLEAALDLAPNASVTAELARALLAHGRVAAAAGVGGADPAEIRAGTELCGGGALACRVADAGDAETATRALDGGLDPEQFTYFQACAALVQSDRLATARVHLDRALAHARRLGAVPVLVQAETWHSVAAYRAGRLDDAVAHATTALGSGGQTAFVEPARVALALALVELDRADEAADVCDASTPGLRFARGHVRLARWDPRGAFDDFLSASEDDRLPWRSAAAMAAGAPGEALAREEYTRAGRFGAPRAIGLALRALAAAGPPAERTERLREAVDVLAAGEARLEHAHALCDLGASLRRGRARREARKPLRGALDIAIQCGAAALVRRAREELAASGARPRRLAQSGRDSLTPAELRVAGLAARGLANREIAQGLFVTIKTVETELGHAYAKLGIRSRRELTAALRQS